MRFLLCTLAVLCAGPVCQRAQTTGTELFLKPEEVGAHKDVWQVTPQRDEIVVFYAEEWANGQQALKAGATARNEDSRRTPHLASLYVDGGSLTTWRRGTRKRPATAR